MTKLNLSYIAGFFDGEGCVSATTKGIRIIFTNTNLPLLQEIKKFFGIKSSINAKGGERKLNCYYLTYWNRNAEAILRILQPYLIIKLDQCNLALEFQKTVGTPGSTIGRWGNTALKEEIMKERKRVCKELKKSKRRSW